MGIYDLPPELVFRILHHVPVYDWCTLSLACRHLNRMLKSNEAMAIALTKRFGGRYLVICNALLYLMNPSLQVTKPVTLPPYQTPPSGPWQSNFTSAHVSPITFHTHSGGVALDSRSTSAASQATQDDHTPSVSEIRRRTKDSLGKVLTPQLASLLLRRGAKLPRYICQLAVRDVGHLPPALFAWVIHTGYSLYSDKADFHADDHMSATKIVMDAVLSHWIGEGNHQTPASPTELHHLRVMIVQYGYIPLQAHKRTGNLSYFLFKLANMDMTLIDCMLQNGLDLSAVNDDVLKWVLRRQSGDSLNTLKEFISHGFTLTPAVVSHGLQLSRPDILDALRHLTAAKDLQVYAECAIKELLGPQRIYTTDGILDHLRRSFDISDQVIHDAILMVPPHVHYRTRPYPQQHPATAWRWTLRQFGPHHECTEAAFEDILRKLASGPNSHCCLKNLPEHFISAGVRMQPLHATFIAQMAAVEEMQPLAEQIFNYVKNQLEQAEWKERKEWLDALQEESIRQSSFLVKLIDDLDMSLRRSKRIKVRKCVNE